MIQYHFTCELLSDVIISSASATEGFHPSLDYIPGSKFWGIVAAALYEEDNPQQTSNIFHDGSVRFGDAHLLINGQRSHKFPLSWFRDKHKPERGTYVHHATNYDDIIKDGVQPESMGSDYFNEAGDFAKPLQDFSIKSAYDSDNRRSKDEKMYGYYALPAGSKWAFSVSAESEELLKKIKGALEGKKRIGRSRSAQYGLAKIKNEQSNHSEAESFNSGHQYLYADSAIMLPLDMALSDALPGATIDFGKSKIRTRIYQSWNTERHTRDADRQVIEKGSVIAINLKAPCTADALLQNLQERRAEGFGTVLINPSFLKIKDGYFTAVELKPWKNSSLISKRYFPGQPKDDALIRTLRLRKDAQQKTHAIDAAVNDFIKNHKKMFGGVSASQWGTVRSYAKLFPQKDDLYRELFTGIGNRKGYLVSGIAEEKWRSGRDLIEEIVLGRRDYPHPRNLFLEKLAAEMAKHKREKEEA